MLIPALIAGGLVLGLLIGRWWALVAAAGVAVWILVIWEVEEVPPWLAALMYGAMTGVAIGAGVLLRRFVGRRPGRF